jgi:hypothetical protein
MVTIPVSVGELIDKLSILRVKQSKITNVEKLEYVNNEFEILYNLSSNFLMIEEINSLYNSLFNVNNKLWEIEDKIRILEFEKNFQEEFIEIARSVYHNNDERFRLKNEINKITNSHIREVKDYIKY